MHSATKILSFCCLALSLFMPQLASSHADHRQPLNDDQAIAKATEYTNMIIAKPELAKELALDTLDASWQEATKKRIHKKDLRYFIVSMHNASQEKTLYLLLDSFGGLYGANFSGTFEGL